MKSTVGYSALALAGAMLLGLGVSQSGTAAETMGPEARAACASLKTLSLPDTRITLVEAVSPKKLWPYPKSIFSLIAIPGDKGGVEAPFCRVAGTIEKEIDFELWLPVQWNGKLMGVGNGGYSGALNYTTMGGVIGRGYATATTDTGHETPTDFFDDTWVEGHSQRVVDFGHRGHHMLAVTAKKIVAAFYGENAKHSYFTGCSSGGWQGLTEAQKYPGDYDGIIGDPERCDFDPKQIQCKQGETASCLTPAQVKRARLIYGPAKTAKGLSLYPGNADGTAPFAPPPLPGSSNALALGEPAIMKMTRELAGELPFTLATFDPDRHIPWLEEKIGPTLSSTDPDLSAFADRGGKLIIYHGWNDALLSPYNTIAYYKSVRAEMGRKSVDKLVRLFMAPGMGHCAGGPGPDRFDMIAALERWVEKDEVPESVIAEHRREDLTVDRTRPLCAYPKVARYKGSGSTDDAANFVCK